MLWVASDVTILVAMMYFPWCEVLYVVVFFHSYVFPSDFCVISPDGNGLSQTMPRSNGPYIACDDTISWSHVNVLHVRSAALGSDLSCFSSSGGFASSTVALSLLTIIRVSSRELPATPTSNAWPV